MILVLGNRYLRQELSHHGRVAYSWLVDVGDQKRRALNASNTFGGPIYVGNMSRPLWKS